MSGQDEMVSRGVLIEEVNVDEEDLDLVDAISDCSRVTGTTTATAARAWLQHPFAGWQGWQRLNSAQLFRSLSVFG